MSELLSTETTHEIVPYGLGESTLTVFCSQTAFYVHREVICQASEVWNKMLTGNFAEASTESVTLRDDDPEALELAFDIIYSQLSGSMDCSTFTVEAELDAPLQTIIDKYQLTGVSAFVKTAAHIRQLLTSAASQRQEHSTAMANARTQHERDMRDQRMKPGMYVEYYDHPPIGTRVQSSDDSTQRGKITANDEDHGTEIAVRWDDGRVQHNLWCGKKGGRALKYC